MISTLIQTNNLKSDNGFSFEKAKRLRDEAGAFRRCLDATSQLLAQEIASFDAAVQASLAERGIDEHLALVSAARRLAEVLETAVTR